MISSPLNPRVLPSFFSSICVTSLSMDQADFKIAYDGTWYHDGTRIQRDALAKLFSDRALKIDEEGRYWLQTPFEKYPVEVDDVPYVIVDYDVSGEDLDLKTNMEEVIELGSDNAWELRDEIPYVEVRDGLFARVGRSVYYNLIEAYGPSFKSRGAEFALGVVDE